MREVTDQNLLFAAIALQTKAVSADDLADGLLSLSQDSASSLAELLIERGLITNDTRSAISALMQARMRAHADDPTKSLAEFSSVDEFNKLLRSLDRPDYTNSWQQSTRRPSRSHQPTARTAGDRFQIIRFHNEGGLGRVYLALDTELGRQVALKELKKRSVDDAASQNRFVIEAEVTGGLEHPSIVPVYSLGKYADGRPYYAMRFIEGVDLQQAVRSHHAGSKGRSSKTRSTSAASSSQSGSNSQPTNGRLLRTQGGLELRRLLRHFIDACQAIDFAHSRGVLHRDIKPSNIMVGNYGETLVVDWGLAKWQHSHEDELSGESQPALMPKSQSGVASTQHGVVVGTPAYMSPEQANGETVGLGPGTDIFGLGATLHFLLFNQSPYDGSADVVQSARQRELTLPAARLNKTLAPLRSICLKAMEKLPSDRYESAGALALDVERYLADEQVEAHEESYGERMRRLARRHRTWFLAAGISLAAIALASTASLWQVTKAKNQAVASDQRTGRVMDYLVQVLRKPDPGVWGPGVTVASLLDRAEDDLDARLAEESDPLAKAAILRAIGETYRGLGMFRESTRLLQRAVNYQLETLGERHPETLQTMQLLGSSQFDGGDPAAGETIQRVVALRQEELGAEHPKTLDSMTNLARWKQLREGAIVALPYFEKVHQLREEQQGLQHPQTIKSLINVGFAYDRVGRHADAIEIYEDCLERYQQTPQPSKLDILRTKNLLASARFYHQRWQEAFRAYHQNLAECQQSLPADHPETLRSLHNLATAYLDINRPELAIPLFKQVAIKRTSLLGPKHTDAQETLHNLAVAQMQQQAFDEAADNLASLLDTADVIQNTASLKIDKIKYLAGYVAMQRGNRLQAIDMLRSVGEDYDVFPYAEFGKASLGSLLLEIGEEAQGRELLNSVSTKLESDNIVWHRSVLWYAQRTHEIMATALEKLGESEAADRMVRKIEEINRAFPPVELAADGGPAEQTDSQN